MKQIIIAVVVLFSVGLSLSLLLAYFSKVFYVKEDPRVNAIEEVLPGVNCGACGFAGCSAFAKGCVSGELPYCPVGGNETSAKIAKILGVSSQDNERMVALVKCAGTHERANQRGNGLKGVTSCREAQLLGGTKDCRHGCLGYGDCVNVCNYDAIKIYKGGIAIVDPDKCIGCQLCVAACPVNVIEMVPQSRTNHVLCNSKDIGAITRASCSVGCIACKLCSRKDDKFIIVDNVAKYAGTTSSAEVPFVCPNNVIVDTEKYSVRAFVESKSAREEFESEKAEFKEKERQARLKAAAERKAAAAAKKAETEKTEKKEDKDA